MPQVWRGSCIAATVWPALLHEGRCRRLKGAHSHSCRPTNGAPSSQPLPCLSNAAGRGVGDCQLPWGDACCCCWSDRLADRKELARDLLCCLCNGSRTVACQFSSHETWCAKTPNMLRWTKMRPLMAHIPAALHTADHCYVLHMCVCCCHRRLSQTQAPCLLL
jgi:hypothetical protein